MSSRMIGTQNHERQHVVIRDEVIIGDLEAVRELVSSTGFFHGFEVDIAVELVDDRLTKGAASDYQFVLAESDGRMTGYACYGVIACTVGSFDLYWIAVHKHCQGKGLGRILLEQAELRIAAQGGRKVYIETSGRALYVPTRQFYERCGYTVEATLPDFYADGDAKVMYAKRLPLATRG